MYEYSVYIISTPPPPSSNISHVPLLLRLMTPSLPIVTCVYIHNQLSPSSIAHIYMCLTLISLELITYQGV